MNILITGVGGQGTILASKILAAAALYDNNNAMTGETIGMSQRGGSVLSHVRIGDILSPYIPQGEGDLLLSLELCEGARCLPFMRKGASAIVSHTQIKPVATAISGATYDTELMRRLLMEKCHVHFIDAEEIAQRCGSTKAANIVLLGTAYGKGLLNLSRSSLIRSMRENINEKYIEQNLLAFSEGEKAGQKALSAIL